MFIPDATRLPTLDGARLRLRQLDDRDVPALYTVFGDPEVARFWAVPALEHESAAADIVAQARTNFEARRGFRWGIALRADDTIIGTCSLFNLDAANRRAEVGYALARTQWRNGYASEALALAMGFGFTMLGLRRLEADVDPRNGASLHMLERLGFQREGYLRERFEVAGEIQDSVVLGLLASEWRASRPDATVPA